MRAARLLLRSLHRGVLSTVSVQFPGYPFGSALLYAVDPLGRPLILVSDLAAHTKNMLANANVSLCAHQDDILAGSRVTIVGTASIVDDDGAARDRYLRMFPDALARAAFGDFHLYRIEPQGGHYVGGFGKIRTFDRESYMVRPSALNEREPDIVGHMNANHVPALRDFCRYYHGVKARRVEMLSIDCDGFDVRAGHQVLRMTFVDPVKDAGAARAQLVKMTREARSETALS
jgi:putative heme iron utilization protein